MRWPAPFAARAPGSSRPQRPIGSFLFLGPTGVGKTEMARTLANFLFGSDKALIRFDMSEFMEKHSVSKLIGSPPGYVGYEEGGQLTERVKRSPYSVVLLDEIEKAHPDVFNILLQVFEDGQLTDGLGNTVDFKNTILIMTSNIGARHLMKKQGLGFQSDREDIVSDKVEELVKQEVKKTFNPEFLNRLDEVILFQSLSDADLIQIVELLVQQLNANLAQKSITISVTEEAKKWILDKTLVDRSYGARPLRRALQRYVEDPLSRSPDRRPNHRAASLPRGLPRRQPALLSPGQRRRDRNRREARRHSALQRCLRRLNDYWVPSSRFRGLGTRQNQSHFIRINWFTFRYASPVSSQVPYDISANAREQGQGAFCVSGRSLIAGALNPL